MFKLKTIYLCIYYCKLFISLLLTKNQKNIINLFNLKIFFKHLFFSIQNFIKFLN